ncbi:MAG TPA: transglutaminase-like domain-containing protein [Thermoanaerobaculia bacterium]
MKGRRALAGAVLAACLTAGRSTFAAEERALYLAEGDDVRLFDHYDNDGYSLEVEPAADGAVRLRVRVDDAPLESSAPFPTGAPRDAALPPSRERDAFAADATRGSPRQSDAVARVLVALAARVRYDADLRLPQDPAAVYASRRADCVGFAELAVDLLRRAGVRARTVQGILRTNPGQPAHEARIAGAYHRWIEVYYPDRGWVFSDPSASINGVDARYIPFRARALSKPRSLTLVFVDQSGGLSYAPVDAGPARLLERPAARALAKP